MILKITWYALRTCALVFLDTNFINKELSKRYFLKGKAIEYRILSWIYQYYFYQLGHENNKVIKFINSY